MELRQTPASKRTDRERSSPSWLALLLLLNLAGIAALVFLQLRAPGGTTDAAAERLRTVAGKLQAAGALGEAAQLYATYLDTARPDDEDAAKIAYSLGKSYLDQGQPALALRWLYEAEAREPGELGGEIRRQIVRGLDRLGNPFGAQAALDAGVRLGEPEGGPKEDVGGPDPVVARIGTREVRRSEVAAALADLPPEQAAEASKPEARESVLRGYVAEELLWNKARKLGLDRDPAVLAQIEAAGRQLAVARLVEEEILGKLEVAPSDVRLFFEANKEGFRREDGAEPSFEELRPRVEAAYRQSKARAAYEEMVRAELAAAQVELYPERMDDGG